MFVNFVSSDVVKPTWIYNLIILISTVVFFLLPMLIISILYLLIGLRLHRERLMTEVDARCSFGAESLTRTHKQKLSKRNVQVTKMLCRSSLQAAKELKTSCDCLRVCE